MQTAVLALARQKERHDLLFLVKPQVLAQALFKTAREGRSFFVRCPLSVQDFRPMSYAEIFYVEKAGSIVYTILFLLMNYGCLKAFVHWAGGCRGLCSSQLLHVTGFVLPAMQTAGNRHSAYSAGRNIKAKLPPVLPVFFCLCDAAVPYVGRDEQKKCSFAGRVTGRTEEIQSYCLRWGHAADQGLTAFSPTPSLPRRELSWKNCSPAF